MADNKIVTVSEQENAQNIPTATEEITVRELLGRIDAIRKDTAALNEAIRTLGLMSDGDNAGPGSPGNTAAEAKASAIADVVRCRETTNQKILSIYEMMYKDIIGTGKETMVAKVIEELPGAASEEEMRAIHAILCTILNL